MSSPLLLTLALCAVIAYSATAQNPPDWHENARTPPILYDETDDSFHETTISTVAYSYDPVDISETSPSPSTSPSTYSVPFTSTELNTKQSIIRNFTRPTWIKYFTGSIAQTISRGHDNRTIIYPSDLTAYQSLNSLWVMNLTKEYHQANMFVTMAYFEFHDAIQHISDNDEPGRYKEDYRNYVFSFINQTIPVQEIITGYLGPLLSAYALEPNPRTDVWYYENPLGKKGYFTKTMVNLKTALIGEHGLPYKLIHSGTGEAFSQTFSLGEFGPIGMMEYGYLKSLYSKEEGQGHASQADVKSLVQPYKKMFGFLKLMNTTTERPKGLYMSELSFDKFWNAEVSGMSTLFAPASPFYLMLIKTYIASNRTDAETLKLYVDAIDAVDKIGMISRSDGLTFAQSYFNDNDTLDRTMHHDGCGLGAMFALGAWAMNETLEADGTIGFEPKEVTSERVSKHMNWAVQLTETCHSITNRSKSGLFPDKVIFHENGTIESVEGAFHDHADLAESYFVLWRLTKAPKYQHYAWELFEALYQHLKASSPTANDISGPSPGPGHKHNIERITEILESQFNVNATDVVFTKHSDDPDYIDIPGKLFSTTLKYLYLTFAPLDLLPLDKWVFNHVGQPIPVYL